ncbi:type II secretion system protein GspD [Candidatus Poribacteria bacterium]
MFEHTSRQHFVFIGMILLLVSAPGASRYFGSDVSAQVAEPEIATDLPEDMPDSADQPYEKSVFFIPSPYRSLEKTHQFIDTVVLRTILPMGYVEEQPTDDRPMLKLPAHAQLYRYFAKSLENVRGKEIELVVASYPKAGEYVETETTAKGPYEIYVYGSEHGEIDERRPNSDILNIEVSMHALAEEITIEAVAHEVYQLSYIQSDSALGLLKALGYRTIEYNQQPGETDDEKIYSIIEEKGKLEMPAIIKIPDPRKTTFVGGRPKEADPKKIDLRTTFYLGGTPLEEKTSGEPQQRLLILYDKNDLDTLQVLLNLLQEKIDRPAKQVIIEAMVIELNTDKKSELGVSFTADKGKYQILAQQLIPGTTALEPFTFAFDKNAADAILLFQSTLKALVETGDAEVLSNPSVLVLDGRQARIQVGQQVPVIRSNTTAEGIIRAVEYIPIGIVLNLRPRINSANTEITMQVETVVSAIQEIRGAADVFFAPTIDSREVQTFVRVANNTPFIIGGLIATNVKESIAGIPFLSRIPLLGIPFRRKKMDKIQKEVIVVLTPHVVPIEEKNFSYVIPKDSEMFDSFGYHLFRNAYRVRRDDVFDLSFLYENRAYKELVEEMEVAVEIVPRLQRDDNIGSILKGNIPGEEVMVRRMLWEIIAYKLSYHQYIDMDKVIFFEDLPDDPNGLMLTYLSEKTSLLNEKAPDEDETLALIFDANPGGSLETLGQSGLESERLFVQPKATIVYEPLTGETYTQRLARLNQRHSDGTPDKWTMLLTKAKLRIKPLNEILPGVLVLKRVLELNGSSLPLTIREFKPGQQILFPAEQDLHSDYHVIDSKVAQLFYEVILYYPALEETFKYEVKRIYEKLDNVIPE